MVRLQVFEFLSAVMEYDVYYAFYSCFTNDITMVMVSYIRMPGVYLVCVD